MLIFVDYERRSLVDFLEEGKKQTGLPKNPINLHIISSIQRPPLNVTQSPEQIKLN